MDHQTGLMGFRFLAAGDGYHGVRNLVYSIEWWWWWKQHNVEVGRWWRAKTYTKK